jgi:hypothetical protein
VLVLTLLTGIVSAIPTTGDATLVGSNNFTVEVTGASGYAYVIWGQSTGNNNWMSENASVTGGAATITVWGAPIIGGRTVYYKACDATGCGAEKTASIATVTPIPVPSYGDPLRRITSSHFALPNITAEMPNALTALGTPIMIFWGIIYIAFLVGLWLRTRTVRLSLMIMFLTAPFMISPTAGLYLGIPTALAYVMLQLAGAMLAGVVYVFTKK